MRPLPTIHAAKPGRWSGRFRRIRSHRWAKSRNGARAARIAHRRGYVEVSRWSACSVKLSLTVLGAAVVGVMLGTTAFAQESGEPLPKPLPADEVAAINSPVAPTETRFKYKNGTIAVNEAARRDMACIEKRGRHKCYDTEAQMESAEGLTPVVRSRASSSRAKGKAGSRTRARARAAHHGAVMSIWEHSDYHGWRVDTQTCDLWFNLTGGYNDNASSLKTGDHTGYISVHNGGIGQRLGWAPRHIIPHLSVYKLSDLADGDWDNDASSRRRC